MRWLSIPLPRNPRVRLTIRRDGEQTRRQQAPPRAPPRGEESEFRTILGAVRHRRRARSFLGDAGPFRTRAAMKPAARFVALVDGAAVPSGRGRVCPGSARARPPGEKPGVLHRSWIHRSRRHPLPALLLLLPPCSRSLCSPSLDRAADGGHRSRHCHRSAVLALRSQCLGCLVRERHLPARVRAGRGRGRGRLRLCFSRLPGWADRDCLRSVGRAHLRRMVPLHDPVR